MGNSVRVEHYDLKSNSFIGNSLNDLNSGDDITDPPPDDGTLEENDDDQNSAVVSDSMHESYQTSLPLHSLGMEDDHSSLENNDPASCLYTNLTIEDVSPIETTRARFLEFLVDHFFDQHMVETSDYEADYMVQQSTQDKVSKRKSREIKCEGDARYALPLMYAANLYETLVNEVNMRLSSFSGMHAKTIGVALEAAGGLYRKLSQKFPRKGPYSFKRRELATSIETRSRFPELVMQEEKRVRFVVVNGLSVIEKPTKIGIDDAEWFKRLTGRTEVAVSAGDYKFYAPRHKNRRASNSVSNISGLPVFSTPENSSPVSTSRSYHLGHENTEQTPSKHHVQQLPHQAQFHILHHNNHFPMNQSASASQFIHNQQCVPSLPNLAHNQQTSLVQHIASLQSLGNIGGRLHIMPASPAKFCDECGVPFLRETSKFCSECGTKRFGN